MAKTTKKAPAKKAAPKKAAAKKVTASKGKAPAKKSTAAAKTTASRKSTTVKATATKATAKHSTGTKPAAKSAAATKKRSTAKKSSASSKMTIDHDEIRQWAEARGGKPSTVSGTGGKDDVGLLRLEFPDQPFANDGKLEEITWDEFFEKFDQQQLALLYQEETAGGKQSSFNKLIDRNKAMLPK